MAGGGYLLKHITERYGLINARCEPKRFAEYVVAGGNYSIESFLIGLRDTGEGLAMMRQTIDSYSPPSMSRSLYRVLRLQLETLELDLHIHSRLEEDVLIPKALKIEARLRKKVRWMVNRN